MKMSLVNNGQININCYSSTTLDEWLLFGSVTQLLKFITNIDIKSIQTKNKLK